MDWIGGMGFVLSVSSDNLPFVATGLELMTEHEAHPPGFTGPAWDFGLFAVASVVGGIASAMEHPVVVTVNCLAAVIALKVRLARLDSWNRSRAPSARLGAGSKFNHAFSMILFVVGAQAACLAAWNATR